MAKSYRPFCGLVANEIKAVEIRSGKRSTTTTTRRENEGARILARAASGTLGGRAKNKS